jgi:hypothetical protein
MFECLLHMFEGLLETLQGHHTLHPLVDIGVDGVLCCACCAVPAGA